MQDRREWMTRRGLRTCPSLAFARPYVGDAITYSVAHGPHARLSSATTIRALQWPPNDQLHPFKRQMIALTKNYSLLLPKLAGLVKIQP